ncbi:MAG: hypothetical protein AB7P14_11810 [Blastocatellales bacterium]
MKQFFFKAAISAALTLTLILPALAQSAETPESVAKAYFAAMKAGDWAKCASYMHPEALASMKRSFGAVVKSDKSERTARDIFGLNGNADFEKLSDARVFERLMDFIASAVPELKTALASSTNNVLGQVGEGQELVHIVYRTLLKLGQREVSQVELISLKKSGTTWRALLTADMEELFEKFAEGMSGK